MESIVISLLYISFIYILSNLNPIFGSYFIILKPPNAIVVSALITPFNALDFTNLKLLSG